MSNKTHKVLNFILKSYRFKVNCILQDQKALKQCKWNLSGCKAFNKKEEYIEFLINCVKANAKNLQSLERKIKGIKIAIKKCQTNYNNMSSDRLHFGKFRILTKTTEETKQYIKNYLVSENKAIFIDKEDWDFDIIDNDYLALFVKNELILIKFFQHEKQVDDPYITKVLQNGENINDYFFICNYYDGGTCLEEQLENELNNIL